MAESKSTLDHGPSTAASASLLDLVQSIRLQIDSQLGRIVVANVAFAVGDLVLAEDPMLLWKPSGEGDSHYFKQFIAAFLSASELAQQCIEDMACPPDSVAHQLPHYASHLKIAAVLAKNTGSVISAEKILRLMLICNTNAHTFRDASTSAVVYAVPSAASAARQPSSALFNMASKVAHSCQPNCGYSSRHGSQLRYFAIRPILPGEMITISYIGGDLFSRPRTERRALLQASKWFLCKCERCRGVDDCRGFCCSVVNCAGLVRRNDDQPSGGGLWNCSKCASSWSDEQFKPWLVREADLLQQLNGINTESPLPALRLFATASASLSPLHYITIRAQHTLATVYVSIAENLARLMPNGPMVPVPWGGKANAASLRQESGIAGVEEIQLLECLAADCTDLACLHSRYPHTPSYDCMETAMFAVLDMIKSGGELGQNAAIKLAVRYLPMLRLQFSEGDEDIATINSFVRRSEAANVAHANSAKAKSAKSVKSAALMLLPKQCNCCGAALSEKPMLCMKCSCVAYCDVDCLNKQAPKHKKDCKNLAASRW